MSNNRSTSTKTKTLADYYNDFFSLVLDMVVPCIPANYLEKPEISSILSVIPRYCDDDKKFVLVHYGIVKKLCSDPNTLKAIKNITDLVDESPESKIKLKESVSEIKVAASRISEICQSIIEADDIKIEEKIEEFCLFVDILTRQFVPPSNKK